MKVMAALLLSMFLLTVQAQHRLVKLWETPPNIPVPESVLPHNNSLYISLIDGAPWEKDGKGGIGMLSSDGKEFDEHWITGLSAPKGMAITGNKLYVADITEVAVIDMVKRSILKRIPIPTSQNLNDVTIGNGSVFVSDSKAGRIWQIKNDVPSLYLDHVPATNGLKFINNLLYFGAGNKLKKVDNKKRITTIIEVSSAIDGIEPLKNGDFILTSWPGYIYYVAKGSYQTLLETHQQNINSADIGVDSKKNIVYVPTFSHKTVVAYQVK